MLLSFAFAALSYTTSEPGTDNDTIEQARANLYICHSILLMELRRGITTLNCGRGRIILIKKSGPITLPIFEEM